jgi:hypothetical protein
VYPNEKREVKKEKHVRTVVEKDDVVNYILIFSNFR